jgi:hypothetical protein
LAVLVVATPDTKPGPGDWFETSSPTGEDFTKEEKAKKCFE